MIYQPSEEESIVLRAKKGERSAFDKLYERYKRPILNYTYRFIGNLAQAEELTQEVFVRVYMNIHRYEPRAKFSSWIYRIAGNLAKNSLRRASYEKRFVPSNKGSYDGDLAEGDFLDNIEDAAKRPDQSAQTAETGQIVQDAIGKLPVQLKEAIILCDIQGFSYEEAAKVMKCKPMTVGSRIWRAREKLASLLKAHDVRGEEEIK